MLMSEAGVWGGWSFRRPIRNAILEVSFVSLDSLVVRSQAQTMG